MLEQDWLAIFYLVHSYIEKKWTTNEGGYFNNIISGKEKTIIQLSIDITNEIYNGDLDHAFVPNIYEFLEIKNTGR